MAIDDPNELERVDQEIRINELKAEAEELAGGDMATYEADSLSPNIAEAFWQHVVAYEKAPLTCPFQQLLDAGIELPAPEAMTDADLTAKLWEVIHRLAKMRVFITSTNHLSDRELYAHLWSDSLRESTPGIVFGKHSAGMIDLLGSGSDEATHLEMKFYANEESRARWLQSFPDYEMPPHETPPYDRDRHLPQAPW